MKDFNRREQTASRRSQPSSRIASKGELSFPGNLLFLSLYFTFGSPLEGPSASVGFPLAVQAPENLVSLAPWVAQSFPLVGAPAPTILFMLFLCLAQQASKRGKEGLGERWVK